jgi:exopolysaccharide biosynthesis predicted pyruvyltransferase EpsI|tara:strand:+ start:683 stop:871 length:189 start_codon:yes stop_codon:yes gene_type:complete
MVDQTQHEIAEVILKNSVKRHQNQTKKMFDDWLKDCPVKNYLKSNESDNDIQTIIFRIKDRK